jgi:hypothetical protein
VPRALFAEFRTVSESERPAAIDEWRRRRSSLAAAGCHYWVYESTSQRGRFLEFSEGRDAESLHRVRREAGMPESPLDLYDEVELA